MTWLALVVLALVLLWPAPLLLARARWPHREPRAALVLWQAFGLAGGLALVGAALAIALAPLREGLFGGLHTVLTRGMAGLSWAHAGLLAVALGLGAWLTGVLAHRFVRTVLTQRRHRELLDLVAEPWPVKDGGPGSGTREGFGGDPAHGRVLSHPQAVAYCVPGADPRVVLSSGALDLLDEAELFAVVAHERAHLAERHDLVVLAFTAWTAALPGLPGARKARSAVTTLIEMLADDRACMVCDRAALATALARVGSAGAPAGALAAGGGATVARVHRLLEPPAPSPLIRLAAYSGAALLLAVPTLALLLT
ncbi:M56 family metallopeptidase [Longispora albida]|uniref:M56 family metallopeptidase n=1 Tax=Longispora albida TaxID=203523 RepID=UPI0003729A66|nr:M56 family metallopeptidase [Longispora albida]